MAADSGRNTPRPSPVHHGQDRHARDAINVNYAAQLRAMLAGDTDALASLLSADMTLTHMTGYRQARDEWLAQMQDGHFVYHSITEKEYGLDVTGETARPVSRLLTDATIYGTRSRWRLALAQDFERRDKHWICIRSVASTW